MLEQILIIIRKLYIIFVVLFISLNLFGANYYVNDDSTNGDRYCTAVGNDTNDGKTPATPKRTITNLLSTYNLEPGDVVYIDAGIYNERVVITSDDGGDSTGYVTFKGVASGGTNAVINGTGASGWDACIELDGVNYVKIDSLYISYFDKTSGDVRGIKCYNNCSNLIIINNIIVSNRREGIRFADGGGVYYSIISNNKCNYNDRINDWWPAGIVLNNAYSNKIVKNECLYNGISAGKGNGIRIENASLYNTVISNNCSFNMRIGIEITNQGSQSKYNTLIGNTCEGNTNEGIVINHPYNIVKKNIINNNKVGIKLENQGTNNAILSNYIYNNSSDGIQVFATGNGLTNNKIHNNNGLGIKVDGANPNINFIIRNEIFSNSSHGIALYRGNNIVISNQIYGNEAGIVLDWDGTNSFIIGNEIYNNNWYGISLSKSKNIISNNTIYNCSHGIHLSDNVIQNKILKNEIYNNTWDGIVGEGGDYNTIISNNIHHNSAAGISLWNNTNSYNIINGNKIWGNGSAGININGDGNILRYNIVYSNGGNSSSIERWGIRIDGLKGAPLTNEFNVSYDNAWEGIMIDNAGSGSLVKNCTLFRNGADGIDLNGGSLLVKNCISVSNSGYGYNRTDGTMTVNYCDAYGNNSGAYDSATTNKCLTADPKFESTNPSDTNFLHLSGWSPCINAGDPTDTVPSGGGTRIDMGIYEYQVPPPPQITSISTNEIGRGNELTITGLNFQDNQYLSTVAFSNTTDGLVPVSEYNLWNNTTIKVTVPSGLSVGTTNSIKVTTWGGTDITNKAVVIIDALPDIIKTGPKAPSVTPTKGKTTTSFTLSVYYRDVDGDPPAINYPKCVTTTNGVPAFTNIMSTNVSSGSWTNRLCQTVFTIPFEHSNISNFFILKAATGNTNEYITGSFKLISRVDDTALPATGLSKSTATETSITVKWNIQEPYIVSQTIYWNTFSPATAGSSATLSASATSYKIENLTPGTEYYIIVRTYDDLGNYADTGELKVITGGARPPSDKLAVRNNFISPEHPVAYIYVNNPANPQANIIIKVYTIYGKLVKELVNAPLENINQPIIWDGTDSKGNKVPSGVYIIYGEGYKYNERKRVYVVR